MAPSSPADEAMGRSQDDRILNAETATEVLLVLGMPQRHHVEVSARGGVRPGEDSRCKA